MARVEGITPLNFSHNPSRQRCLTWQDAAWGGVVFVILLLTPLFQLNPNRVTEGPSVYFLQLLVTQPLVALVLLVGFGLAVISLPNFRGPLVVLIALLLGTLPTITWPYAAELFRATRVAPTLGFWLLECALLYRVFLGRGHTTSLTWIFWGLVLGIAGVDFALGGFNALSVVKEAASDPPRILEALGQHLSLTFWSVGVALILGLPLGVVAFKTRWGKGLMQLILAIQTVPSIALFGLFMIPLAALTHRWPWVKAWGIDGIGTFPVEIALTLWALLPLASAVNAGLALVSQDVKRAAQGLGFSPRESFWQVEVPLALPSALAGFRVAVVQTVGNATLAPLIGGGGLGWFIFQGIGQTSSDMVVLGVILVLLVTVVLDQLLRLLIDVSQRRNLRANS